MCRLRLTTSRLTLILACIALAGCPRSNSVSDSAVGMVDLSVQSSPDLSIVCADGERLCAGTCLPSSACCTAADCPAPPSNATASCVSNQCGVACNQGYGMCMGVCLPNAAQCCVASDCSGNHVTRSCTSGTCDGVCDTGYADCDSNKQTDGCEVGTTADAYNCGSCNHVCSHPSCSGGLCAGLNSGLVAYWSFDEGAGSGAADSSGNGNNGALSGATWTTGKLGGALQFGNGGGNIVTVPTISALGYEQTRAVWIYPTNVASNTDQYIFDEGGNTDWIQLYDGHGIGELTVRAGGITYFVDGNIPIDTVNTWYFIVVAIDHFGTLSIYVNGILDASNTVSRPWSGPIAIGNTNGGGQNFQGKIDEVSVWNRALSGDEITLLYNSGAGNALPFAPANRVSTCANSTCGVACSQGFADCDGHVDDGCETNVTTDPNYCGSCSNVCSSYPNQSSSCTGGTCNSTCTQGYAHCTGPVSDGCETDITTTQHCGSCNNSCPAPLYPNQVATCTSGTCGVACSSGFAHCSGPLSNGCETDITTAAHCGSCTPCTLGTNVSAVACNAGACAVSSCATGYDNCNGTYADGCEVNLQTDAANCGACEHQCGAHEVCSGGACTCAPNYTLCGSTCVSVHTDVNNCNGCNNVCPAGASCGDTYYGTMCYCPDYWSACGGNTCINLTADVHNCGQCGWDCGAHGGNACCNYGYGNAYCMNVSSDNNNCGSCFHACTGGSTCQGGTCTCSGGKSLCSGTCVDLTSDNSNCGTCGYVCTGGATCNGGVCGSCTPAATDTVSCTGAIPNASAATKTRTCNAYGTSYVYGTCTVTACQSGYAVSNNTCVSSPVNCLGRYNGSAGAYIEFDTNGVCILSGGGSTATCSCTGGGNVTMTCGGYSVSGTFASDCSSFTSGGYTYPKAP